MKVVVIAPQRTGTNFLENLLKQNFEDIKVQNQDSNYIWKHRAWPSDVENKLTNEVLHFIMHKNPYKWVESIMRYNADLDKRWGGDKGQHSDKYFDMRDGDIQIKDKRGRTTNIGGACRLWNDFYTNWSSQQIVTNVMWVRYEDLLVPEKRNKILSDIESKGLKKKANVREWTVPNKVGQSDPWSDKRTKNYLDLNHFEKLEQKHFDLINKYIDKQWFDKYDYPYFDAKPWNIDNRKK